MAFQFGSLSPENATNKALSGSQNQLQQMFDYSSSFPQNYSNQTLDPSLRQTASYTPNEAFQRIAAPELQQGPEYQQQQYRGLMGGDYDRLEQALQTPVYDAYDRTVQDIDTRLGGQGLYGSSVQQNSIGQAARDVLTPGLAGATAKRYGLEQVDLGNQNDFNLGQAQFAARYGLDAANSINDARLDLFGQEIDQERTAYESSLIDAQRRQGYEQADLDRIHANDQAWRDAVNQRKAQDFDYELQRGAFDRGLMDWRFNNALGQATGTLPGYNAAQQSRDSRYEAQLAADAARRRDNADSQSAWIGAGGSLLGGLLGGAGSAGGFGNLFSW